jgi:ribosomal protein S3AE
MVDPFSEKDWHDVKALAVFSLRNVGKHWSQVLQEPKLHLIALKGCVFKVSLADLQNDKVAFRKIFRARTV